MKKVLRILIAICIIVSSVFDSPNRSIPLTSRHLKWKNGKRTQGNRKRLAESGKAEFLLLLAVMGAPHLNEKEVVSFNLSPEVFEPEIRHYLFEHLADCFRCRARCRRVSYDDFRDAYPKKYKDEIVRQQYDYYLKDEDLVFEDRPG